MINHGWIALANRKPTLDKYRHSRLGGAASLSLTFLAVVVAWVFFRASSFAAALDILHGMAGRHGAALPEGLAFAVRPAIKQLAALGIGFDSNSGTEFVATWIWIAACLAIIMLLPNTQEFLSRFNPVLMTERAPILHSGSWVFLRWWLSGTWAVAIGAIAFLGIISITRVSPFLYWQF